MQHKKIWFLLITTLILLVPNIYAAVPTHGTPILNSTFAGNNTDENITVFNVTTADADGDPVKNIYNWHRNNTAITHLILPFEGGSNATFTRDYSGFERNMTVNGTSIVWNSSAGIDGRGAYDFGGNDTPDMMRIGNMIREHPNGWSFFAWIKLNALNSRFQMISGNCDQTNGYFIVWSDNRPTLSYTNGTGAQKTIVLPAGIISTNSWYHIGFTIHPNSTVNLYLNGTIRTSQSLNQGIETTLQSAVYHIGNSQTRCGIAYWPKFNGTIDDAVFYNMSLTPAQVLALYNNRTNIIDTSMLVINETWNASITPNDGTGDGTTRTSTSLRINPLLINLFTPENRSRKNVLNQIFNFNVTAGRTTICSLFNNASGTYQNISSISTILHNGNNSITQNSITEASSIFWNIECITPAGTRFSQNTNFTFTVDRTIPVLTFTNPSSNNLTNISTQNFTINTSCTDASGLFAFEYNITSGTDQIFYYLNTTLNNITSYTYTNNTNFSLNTSRTYTQHAMCSDTHTKENIESYNIDKSLLNKELTFVTNNDIPIIITSTGSEEKLNSITTSYEKDRYTFTFDYANLLDGEEKYTYKIQTNDTIHYLNWSQYNGHFIIGSGVGRNWLDFEGINGTYRIYKLLNDYYVEIITNDSSQNFSSIGGLNIADINSTFWYGYTTSTFSTPTPANGTEVGQNANITVVGTSIAGVNNITISVAGAVVQTCFSSPCSYYWDMTDDTFGYYSIQGRTYGNNGDSPTTETRIIIHTDSNATNNKTFIIGLFLLFAFLVFFKQKHASGKTIATMLFFLGGIGLIAYAEDDISKFAGVIIALFSIVSGAVIILNRIFK